MSIKQNDWVAVLINAEANDVQLGENPMATLYSNGIIPENTGIQEKDYYKDIPQVQDAFRGKDGKIDEIAFNQFYDSALRSYQEFAEIPFVEKALDAMGTTPYDSSRLNDLSKSVRDVSAMISPFHDKNRSTYGTRNLWETGSATFSEREVAQANFVRDENGNKLDWTPNDRAGIFKSLFMPALAYASYDEDVYDDNGLLIHQKGELKLDENGDPYTELLGTKESAGKELVKWTDTLSVEGTFANKLDVFDSDSLEKSVGKTIAKTALMLLPYLTPAGKAMGWINAGVALTSALPGLVKSLDGLLLGGSDSDFIKSMNWLDNTMGRFQSSVSDEAKGRFFSMENLGDLIVSSAGQLYSQRNIANKLHNWAPFKNASTNKKFAESMSVGYMALTSASDSYNSFREAGANERLAGIGSLLTMAGFYTLLSQGYFKDKMLQGTMLDEEIRTINDVKQLSNYVNKRAFSDSVKSGAKEVSLKDVAGAWNKVKAFTNKLVEGAKNLPKGFAYETEVYVSRGVNEGIEETMEEVSQDLVKGLGKALEKIGFDVTENESALDFNWTPESALERYGTSFLGGFIGGTVFEGLTQKDLRNDPNYKKYLQSNEMRRMYRDVAQGKADQWRKAINDRYRKKENGNENLAASWESVVDSEGTPSKIYKMGTKSDNQNLAVTNAMLALVDEAELIYSKYNLIFTNKELVEKVMGTESMKQRLGELKMSTHEYMLKNLLAPTMTEAEYVVDALMDLEIGRIGENGKTITFEDILAENVLNDVNTIRDDIFNLELELKSKLSTLPNTATDEDKKEAIKKSASLKAIQKEIDDLVKQFQEIVQGKHADNFFNQALFFLSDSPAKYWTNLGGSIVDSGNATNNIESFAKFKYGIDEFHSVKDSELKEHIEKRYLEYKQNEISRARRIAEMNLALSETITDDLKQLGSRLKDAVEHTSYLFNEKRMLIGDVIKNVETKLEEVTAQIQFLTEQGQAGSPEVANLLEQSRKLNEAHAIYTRLPKEARLDDFFGEDLDVVGNSDAADETRQQIVRDFYKKAISDKAVYVKDDYLRQYLAVRDWEYVIDSFTSISKSLKDIDWSFETILGAINEFNASSEGYQIDVSDFTKEMLEERVQVMIANGISEEEAVVQALMEILDLDDSIAIELIDKSKSFFRGDLNKTLKEKLRSFIGRVKTYPSTLDLEISKLVNFIKSEVTETGYPVFNPESLKKIGIEVNSVEEFVDYLFNPNPESNLNVFNFIKEINSLLEKVEKSPIEELLQKISMSVTGEPSKIFSLISTQKGLVSEQRYENYMLGEEAEKKLYDAQAVLNIVTALIESAKEGGVNELVNTKRKIADKSELTVLDSNSAKILANELLYVQRQLDMFKEISDTNRGNKLAENKNIGKFDSIKRLRKFINPNEESYEKCLENALKEKFGKSFIDFLPENRREMMSDWLRDDLESIQSWSDSDYENFYAAESEFKHNLNVWFKGLNDEDKITVVKIFATVASNGNFSEVLNMTTDEFSSNIKDDVGTWGNVRYLLSNLLSDFYEYNAYYKQVTESSEFLPFYGQEFVVRDAYSAFEAKTYYNIFMDELCNVYKSKDEGDIFRKNLYALKNFLFIDGVPGSGKSTAVAGTLANILRLKYGNKIKIVGLIHDDSGTRKQDFAKNLGIAEEDCYLFTDFIESNIVSGISKIEKKDHHITEEYVNKTNSTNEPKTDHEYYLYVADELTFANEAQLIAFSKWNEKHNNSFLLGLGDMYQSGTGDSDITDTFFPSSVRLTATFRAENSGKANNEQTARDVCRSAYSLLAKDRSIDGVHLSKKVWDNIEIFNTKPLIGFKDENGRIYGDISITKNEISSQIQALLKLNPKPSIAIIADNKSDYAEWEASGIDVKTPTEAQGGQWDYCFVDSSIKFGETSSANYTNFKKFYTIMTRAKHGTAWVASNIDMISFEINGDAKYEVGADMRMDSAKKDYIAWRKSLFGLVPEIEVSTATSTSGSSGTTGGGTTGSGTTGGGTSSSGTSAPSVSEEIVRYNKIYSDSDDSEVTAIRHKYYDSETDDPAVLDFRAKRGYWITPYNERKSNIASGKAFDYDMWWDWMQEDSNLLDRAPVPLSNSDDYVKYRKYLRVLQDYILRWASASDKESILNEMQLYNAESDSLAELHRIIVSNMVSESNLYFETRNVGDPNSSIIYLRVNDASGEAVRLLPLYAQRGVIGGRVYKLDNLKTQFLTKPIPISSNGEKFLPISSFTKKISAKDQILIFKGFKPTDTTPLSKSAEAFNDANRGKAFILVDNVSGDSSFSTWPSYLQIKYKDGDNEVSTFIDEKGNRYVSIIGLQRVCTPETFREICLCYAKASNAKDQTEYDTEVERLRSHLGRNDVTIEHKKFGPENQSEATTIRDIFPPRTCQYLLNVMFRNSKNVDGQVVMKNWLNGSKKRTAIRFEYGKSTNRKYLIIKKSNEDGYFDVWAGSDYNQLKGDPVKVKMPEIENINTVSTFAYWVSNLQEILKNNELASKFGLTSDKVVSAFDEKIGERYKLNIDFAYTYTSPSTNDEMVGSSDFNHTFAIMAQNSDEWSVISEMMSLFKHNIHMKITANQFDDRPESKGIWGVYNSTNDLGFGADLVDILPPSYLFSMGEEETRLSTSQFKTEHSAGKITIPSLGYSTENNNEFVFDGKIVADWNWMRENCATGNFAKDSEWEIRKIIKNPDGTYSIYAGSYSSTSKSLVFATYPMKSPNGEKFFNKFQDNTWSAGGFKVTSKNVFYEGRVVDKVIGFYIENEELKIAMIVDGKLEKTSINTTWREKLTSQLSLTGELVQIIGDPMLAVYIDPNSKTFKVVSDITSDSPEIRTFILNSIQKTINGQKINDSEFNSFMASYNSVAERYGLNEEYNRFKSAIKERIKGIDSKLELEINNLLDVSDSKEDVTNFINELFDSVKWQLGRRYILNGEQIAIDDNIVYRIGKMLLGQLDSYEIVDITTSNSEEFLVSLRDKDGKLSLQKYVYTSATGTISPLVETITKDSDLNELYNVADENIRFVIDKFEAMTKDLSPSEWNDLIDNLYDTLRIDQLALREYIKKLELKYCS